MNETTARLYYACDLLNADRNRTLSQVDCRGISTEKTENFYGIKNSTRYVREYLNEERTIYG